MSDLVNRQIRLAGRPTGWVQPEHFELTEQPVTDPGDGELLLRNIYMSVDPYMRGRMNDVQSYVPPFQIGEVLQGGVVAQVVSSRNSDFAEGDYVTGMLGWENYSISSGEGLNKVVSTDVPLSWYLGILGMPGMTAWVGLTEIAGLKEGESVFVSAASGAVGSVVGQIARIYNCHVAGCAGSDEKLELLKSEFGYDEAFNYKTSKSIPASIAAVCPKGIDVSFENVGGEIFESVMWNMRNFGRIALCGMISNYNDEELQPGPRGMMTIIGKRLTIKGFIVSDHPKACGEFVGKAAGWIAEGKLKYRETVAEGVENAPQAFIDMLNGKNIGKQIVRLSGD
jgi:NADPH-dependent curcumin reductase CurA